MKDLVATRIGILLHLILFVCAQDCPQDGDWPKSSSGSDVVLFCNPLHKALPFQEFENIFGYNIPPLLRQAVQYQFDSILRSRKCTNGTWEAVSGNCPAPAGCWQNNFMDFYCESNDELNGLLCYPKCKSGYYGVGPVCWEQCPPKTTDNGSVCTPHSAIVSSTKHHCPVIDPCGIVKKCTTCPDGYTNMGCFCTKDMPVIVKQTYPRGAGVVPQFPQCPDHLTNCGILCTNGSSPCHNIALVVATDLANAILREPFLQWITALGPDPVTSTLDLLMQLILSPKCSTGVVVRPLLLLFTIIFVIL